MMRRRSAFAARFALACALVAGAASRAAARDDLCDSSYQDCRTPLLTLIQNETTEIDVGLWFMEDARYSNLLIQKFQAGVTVRILMDPRVYPQDSQDQTIMGQLQSAGIPMRKRIASGIEHWKAMIFAGQRTVYFGSANFDAFSFVPVQPYVNYVDETIYFTDDASVVDSFMTKFDNAWIDTTNYANYANVTTLARSYPVYSIDPELNFVPDQDYATRSVSQYNAEKQKIDVDMFRITDERHTNAMISAFGRGVAVRLMIDPSEYRNPARLWDAWNVDRLYAAGIPVRVTAHQGQNHGKLVLLYGLGESIFGSSNWSSASGDSQHEHNYFTHNSALFDWFVNVFDRKWNNTNPAGTAETAPFVPQPPDKPAYQTPANGATGLTTSGVKLVWDGGPWAHVYDIYFGTTSTPPLFAANQNLGPDDPTKTPKQYEKVALPTLAGGTTYYWQIVSKTMAGLTATGPIWSFTTAGTPPPPPPPPPGATTVVLWASDTPSSAIHGNWQPLVDSAAAGGSALWNPDAGQPKIAPALASPANYWEQTFTAYAGTAYHLWIRLRAQNNSLSNDSVHVQFNDSVDSLGSSIDRIGTSGSAEVVLQAGTSDTADHNYGWIDNGWGAAGQNIYFATTGTHTIRIQQREDGAIVDQIVLSPDTYLSAAPGPNDDDTTILPANSGTSNSGGSGGTTIVVWAANVASTAVHGNWQPLADTTAAGGSALWNPDASQAKISPALATPANYWDATFTASAGTAYHLWVRLRAQNNSLSNDSVHVQFNDSVTSGGAAVMQIGTTSSAEVVLQNGPNGAADQNWGWSDNGWGALGANLYFATSGPHTLRVQQREDGAIVDQIVLSPNAYLSSPPGPRQNDATVLPADDGSGN